MPYEFLKINRLKYKVRKFTVECLKEKERDGCFEGRILVIISADQNDDCGYLFSITNTGDLDFNDVVIDYDFLLDAWHFGYGGHGSVYVKKKKIEGELLFLNHLAPGETVQVVRKGYGCHQQFVGNRVDYVRLEYRTTDQELIKKELAVIVDLPGAKDGDRISKKRH